MGKNKLDIINFSKIFDMFGEEAAKDTLKDVNDGKISEKTLEKYLYDDESKEEYAERLKKEYEDLFQKNNINNQTKRAKASSVFALSYYKFSYICPYRFISTKKICAPFWHQSGKYHCCNKSYNGRKSLYSQWFSQSNAFQ